MLSPADKSLIDAFLEQTKDVSPERAGELAGLSGPTVRRFQEGYPSRLTSETREKLEAFVGKASGVPRETQSGRPSVEEKAARYDAIVAFVRSISEGIIDPDGTEADRVRRLPRQAPPTNGGSQEGQRATR